MVLGDLSDLQKPCLSIVINDGSTLDVCLGLVGDLHDVLGLRVDHGLHDVEVDDGTQVVDVRDENVLLACSNKLVKETRVAEAVSWLVSPSRLGLLTGERQRYLRVLEGTILPCRNQPAEGRGAKTPCRLGGIETG